MIISVTDQDSDSQDTHHLYFHKRGSSNDVLKRFSLRLLDLAAFKRTSRGFFFFFFFNKSTTVSLPDPMFFFSLRFLALKRTEEEMS